MMVEKKNPSAVGRGKLRMIKVCLDSKGELFSPLLVLNNSAGALAQ